MKAKGHTVLITGGASGIGLALSEKFLAEGNRVIAVGQNENKLKQLKNRFTGVSVYTCNLGDDTAVNKLVQTLFDHHPELNILINNAGIQHNYSFMNGVEPHLIDNEIRINFTAPVLLTSKLLPLLSRQEQAAIVNVSSGLGLVPKKSAPVYCGTKAALHIYSKALRDQLQGTQIRVFEIIPPVVDTDMTRGRGRGKITPEQLADEFFRCFLRNREEAAIGKVKLLKMINRLFPSFAEAILRNS
ncbi:SDR family oxidoreductase [Paenibacillus sp. GCM10027627]|uniref:SDR family oxidoreductase n=1 Tax=unclassified Paenibacillus TaxID=185978 RepID=UPI0036395AF2